MSIEDEIDEAFEMAIAQLERPMGTQSIRHVLATMRAYTKSVVRQERERCAKVAETAPLMAYCTQSAMAQREQHRADTAAAIRGEPYLPGSGSPAHG